MSLRQRLAISMLAAALPLLLGIEWLRRDMSERAEIDSLVELAMSYMEDGGLDTCLEFPRDFGGPIGRASRAERAEQRQPQSPPPPDEFDRRRPPRRDAPPEGRPRPERDQAAPRERGGRRSPLMIWAYDAELRSQNPRSPELPPSIRAALTGGDEVAAEYDDHGEQQLVAMRTPWPDGPAAVVMITRPAPPTAGTESERGRPDQPGFDQLYRFLGICAAVLIATLLAAWPLVRRIRLLTTAVETAARSGYVEPVPETGRDELAALGKAFNKAGREIRGQIDELESSATALREFLSNTTHDVMQPLTVLQGHLGTIRRRLGSGDKPDAGLIAACQEEAHYIASLIHNLTAAARLESGAVPVSLEPLDLRPVVERAVARHAPMAHSRGLSLDLALPEHAVEIDGDITLLEQAISNLVHNAVRYNSTGQHVAVLLETDAAGFSVRVIDDGPGVDPAQLARLTERRFRTDAARQRSAQGQGLGLAIALEIAERHNLELSFSRPEQGGFEARLRHTH